MHMASSKGPTAGTGGKGRRKLAGRGPTPPAEARTKHPAARRVAAVAKRTAARPAEAPVIVGEWVTGRNPVLEALRARVPAEELLVAVGIEADERLAESLALARERGLTVREVPRGQLERLGTARGADRPSGRAPSTNLDRSPHQGIALKVAPYDYPRADDLLAAVAAGEATPLLVALDGVTDPRNLGSIARSAAAFGSQGLLVPERRSAGVTAGAWKASAGALARVPVARTVNLTRTLRAAKEAGLLVVGLAAEGATSLDDLDAALDPLVLVVGSEGKGLSRLVGEACDLTVSIPLTAGTESLNAGVAAGVALAEVARRRRQR